MLSTTHHKTILISGAGVAGLSLAYWLGRQGHAVTIVERAEALRTGGYAVDVRGTAVQVLKKMGVYDKAEARDTRMKTVTFVNEDASRNATIDADVFGGRAPGDLEIPRGDLLHILRELVGDSVSFCFNDSITAIDNTDEAATVTFMSGSTETYDLVVGADGAHSNVRTLSYGSGQVYDSYLGGKIAIATIPNFLKLDHSEMLYAEVGKSVFVYSSHDDTAKALFLFQDNEHDPVRGAEAQKALLEKTYRSVSAWQVPTVLQHALASDDFYLDTLETITVPSYHNGRCVLLGDAAHCASPAAGQGTSLALIGAYILAGEIARHDNLIDALTAYQSLMQPFAEQNQKLAPMALQGMIMKNKFFIFMRDMMLRFPKLFLAANKPVLDRIQKAAHMETLPEYAAS